jgi:hypothetical protein
MTRDTKRDKTLTSTYPHVFNFGGPAPFTVPGFFALTAFPAALGLGFSGCLAAGFATGFGVGVGVGVDFVASGFFAPPAVGTDFVPTAFGGTLGTAGFFAGVDEGGFFLTAFVVFKFFAASG